MFRLSRKFVAVLMLLWLPLSGGSALAASVSMEAQGSCRDMGMPAMQQHDMGGHHAAGQHRHGASCDSCGVCHLACCGYLAPPSIELAALQLDGLPVTAYLVSFRSITSAPLDPPPLARS